MTTIAEVKTHAKAEHLCEDVKQTSDKKEISYLDALNASFAVVPFDVDINFSVANKAERKKTKYVW